MHLSAPAYDFSKAAYVVEHLATFVTSKQQAQKLVNKVCAKQMGISLTTYNHLVGGGIPTRTTIVAALNWLAR